MPLNRPRVTGTRVVYENRWMRLREDALVWPDGSPGTYSVVEKPPAAVIAAVADDHVWLIEQHRHTIDRVCWELPQGALEDAPDADPEVIARVELEEETGVVASEFRHLGRMYFAYGLSDQPFDAWLATGLSEPGERQLEVSEQGMRAELVPVDRLRPMFAAGQIVDAATVATLSLAGLMGAV